MINSWSELNEVRKQFKSEFTTIENKITEDYEQRIESLIQERDNKIKEVKKNINDRINPKKYDLDLSPLILLSELGTEIGQTVLVKKKKNDLDSYKHILKKYINEDTYIFSFMLSDEISGLHNYKYLKDKSVSIDSISFNEYFEVIKVLERFKHLSNEKPPTI